jgi:phage protein D
MLGWKQGRCGPRPRPQGQLQGRRGDPQRPARPDPHPRAGRRFYQRDPQPARAELGEHHAGRGLQDIAARNTLALRIAPDLAAIALAALHQSRESDTAFLRRLGRENDAVATIKTGTLIFARKGAGTTSTGQPLPTLALTRRSGDGHSWQRQTRDGQAGVTAHWHDRKAARRQSITVGQAEGGKAAKTLRKVYPDAASAQRAATAEHTRLKRAPATLDMRLALGRPDAIPEARVTVTGFKPEIDATPWLITETTHRLDNAGGFITDLKMEVV